MNRSLLINLIFIAFFLEGCSFSLAADVTPPPGSQISAAMPALEPLSGPIYPFVPPSPAAGQSIYQAKCAPCHGEIGLGNGVRATDLPNSVTAIGSSDVARNATPAQWFTIVSQGNLERFMPPFPSLTERQRWDVVAYTYSLSVTPEIIALGKDLYQVHCTRCHGELGKGDGPDSVTAGAQLKKFTDQEFMSGRAIQDFYQVITDGVLPGMPAFNTELADGQRWALANYLRWLTFAEQSVLITSTETIPLTDATVVPGTELSKEISTTLSLTNTQNLGFITGSVINASGGDIPIGTEITLHGFDEMQMVISSTTTIDPDGTYSFPGIEMPMGRIFFSTLQHQGVTYGSEVNEIQSEIQELDLPINIYDTTTETIDLKVDRMHLFFEPMDDNTIRVAELYIISNNGNKTIVATQPGEPNIRFNLPKGAQDLQFQEGELGGRYVLTEGGFGDTLPVYPGSGEYQVLLSYTLPYQRKLELSQTMTMPVDAIVVMIPQGSYKIKGADFDQVENREVQGMSFEMYNHSGLEAGEKLSMTVSGKAGKLLTSSKRGSLVIGLGSLGLVLILLGLWIYWRNKKENESGPLKVVDGVPPVEKEESPESLMDAILAIDDLYQAGELPENAYLERRTELKAKYKRIMDSDQGT